MVVLGTIVNNMPELPEVETVKKVLESRLLGKCIDYVILLREKNILNDPNEFVSSLKDKEILSFSRVGKFIVFHLSNNLVLISHLRMEGKYFFRNKDEIASKHDIAHFYFKDGSYLAYNDTRKFGILKLSTEDKYLSEPPLSQVGPDPFMIKETKVLKEGFKGKNIPVKQALLDQSIMSGLGNIYVDEVLFASKIHPETPAKLINNKQLEIILDNSKKILQMAIDLGGSTIKSYHPDKGVDGEFQIKLKVYGKDGTSCPNCGHRLRRIIVGGRGTTYCPICQKNVALPHVIAITGPISSGKSLVGKYLEKKGYLLLDSDILVHDLYAKKSIQDEIKKFIPELKIKNGEIDRAYLRQYLLDNPNKKVRLEKYIWGKVDESIHRFITAHSKDEKIVLEVPLLFASHIDDYADEIYIIHTNKENEASRIKKVHGDPSHFLNLNKSYFAQEDIKRATAIINNDGTIAQLYKQIDNIICGK